IKEIIRSLYEITSQKAPEDPEDLTLAHYAVDTLDHLDFFQDPMRLAEQVWVVQVLQDYAFLDEHCVIRDSAEWCQMKWLLMLQSHPENMECLKGLGNYWFQLSQSILARLQSTRTSISSNGTDDNAQLTRLTVHFYVRLDRPLQVEARGYLYAAIDFFHRALVVAETRDAVTGDFLSTIAELHMAMGSVSDSPADDYYFTNGVRYLRRAQNLPGHSLSSYLKEFLDNFGRYV
ncbi:hypothetical protein F5884DRAFT_885107, partial [Xylogone sp. PMI_703]